MNCVCETWGDKADVACSKGMSGKENIRQVVAHVCTSSLKTAQSDMTEVT